MAVKIITDSASDLPKSLVEEYDIDVVPFVVLIDNEEYYDGETIGPDELYAAMKDGKTPRTAQVPYERMKETFEKYAKQNESALYIGFSSALSGTYQTAELIRNELREDYPSFDFDTIDSKGASIGEGFMVLDAARMAKEGKSKQEILDRTRRNIEQMDYLFTVDNLEYLQRGGRIGKAAAFFGGLLNIKPLLSVEEGKLVPIEKIRGRKKVYPRIVELLKERGGDLQGQTIGLPHADSPDAVEKLKSMIREETGATDFMELPIGAVIGSHAGPGTFAIVYRKSST
ncbi:MAG TPA: DegV family protein [Bacillales bacterium]|nr:DegV family protein [Bacillales bacterium]